MPIVFGEHATGGANSVFDNGMYDAVTRSFTIVMDNGKPKVNDNNKQLVDVVFALDEENTIRRRYSISFGQNSANKQWSAFAKLIETLTGIKCGDAAQKEVTDEQLVGRNCRIVIEKNSNGYSDVTNVLAPAAPQTARPKPTPQPVGAAPGGSSSDDIPF